MICPRRVPRRPGSDRGRRALVLVGILALVACGERSQRRTGTPPRSAVVVTVGGLRADRLNAYLYSRPTTYAPSSRAEREQGGDLSVDSVSAHGVSFANAFAPGGAVAGLWTLFTGEHPLDSCVFGRDDVPGAVAGATLAERFRGAGFRTAAFAAGMELVSGEGLGRGFEHTASGSGDGRDETMVEEARAWASTVPAGERFLLWLHLRGPGALTDLAASEDATAAAYDEILARTSVRVSGFLRFLAGHDGSTNHLVSSALVLTSPGGLELGERGGYVGPSRSLYETTLRVPLVLRHPGSLTGRRFLADIVGLDRVAPTLTDWFELPPPSPGGGSARGLLPRIDGARPPDPDADAVAMRGRAVSLRTARWRLTWEPGRGAPGAGDPGDGEIGRNGARESDAVRGLALYDLRADPDGRWDVSAERPDVVRRLASRLLVRLEGFAGDCLPRAELDELRRSTPP